MSGRAIRSPTSLLLMPERGGSSVSLHDFGPVGVALVALKENGKDVVLERDDIVEVGKFCFEWLRKHRPQACSCAADYDPKKPLQRCAYCNDLLEAGRELRARRIVLMPPHDRDPPDAMDAGFGFDPRVEGQGRPVTAELDFAGCPAPGVGGYHSKHYDPEEGGRCEWCGMRPPEGEPAS